MATEHDHRPIWALPEPADRKPRYTREQIGHHLAGWFSFSPLWDEIVRTDPDLFD